MFERPRAGERAVLVHANIPEERGAEDLDEFRELVVSAGAEPVAVITGTRKVPDPKYFIGSGKVEEVRACVEQASADVVLVNHALTPAQERNLEQTLKCRVLDRNGLILDIFAQRARSHEGRLQVELAQLQHLSTRLVRGWTHLERQKGGIGLRGPGETQLETDRRLVRARIKQLEERLDKVSRRREQNRKARRKSELPAVSIVGYTNAGKSTLFNRLTAADVYAADQLFATLDPTLRRLPLPGGASVVLADTVGFIRHLPHDLVAAFRSTLEETKQANLLLHVIDASDERRHGAIEQVNAVLTEIGADTVPQIEVFNKIDRLAEGAPRCERGPDGRIVRLWLSAKTGEGCGLLLQALAEHFAEERLCRWLRVPASAGRARSLLYQRGTVLEERLETGSDLLLQVELKRRDLEFLLKQEGITELEGPESEPLHLAAVS